MSVIRGVDGCRGGWLCLSARPGEHRPSAVVFAADACELLAGTALVTARDVPIGLPSTGSRQCDVTARRLLGRLRSSVFPAPVRAALRATSYAAACAASEQACGKKLSRQTYGILPRIRDVDALLRASPALRDSVREVHPEVCFWHWNQRRPLAHSKKSGFGFAERLALVEHVFGSTPAAVRASVPRTLATDDDILDAFAALWTAQRMHDGTAERMIADDERDACGLPMQIWA